MKQKSAGETENARGENLAGILTQFDIICEVYNILRVGDCPKRFRKLEASSS